MAQDKVQAYEAAVRAHAEANAKLEQAEKELTSATKRVEKRKVERQMALDALNKARADLK